MANEWERSWTSDEIRQKSAQWTLAGDAAVLLRLQSEMQNMLARINDVETAVHTLGKDVRGVDVSLANTMNDFLALENTQFLENTVKVEGTFGTQSDAKAENAAQNGADSGAKRTKEQVDSELIPKFNAALKLGIEVLEIAYEKVDLRSAELADEEDEADAVNPVGEHERFVYQPRKRIYTARHLPHVIGSAQFYADDYIGLPRSVAAFSEETGVEDALEFVPEDRKRASTVRNAGQSQSATAPVPSEAPPPASANADSADTAEVPRVDKKVRIEDPPSDSESVPQTTTVAPSASTSKSTMAAAIQEAAKKKRSIFEEDSDDDDGDEEQASVAKPPAKVEPPASNGTASLPATKKHDGDSDDSDWMDDYDAQKTNVASKSDADHREKSTESEPASTSHKTPAVATTSAAAPEHAGREEESDDDSLFASAAKPRKSNVMKEQGNVLASALKAQFQQKRGAVEASESDDDSAKPSLPPAKSQPETKADPPKPTTSAPQSSAAAAASTSTAAASTSTAAKPPAASATPAKKPVSLFDDADEDDGDDSFDLFAPAAKKATTPVNLFSSATQPQTSAAKIPESQIAEKRETSAPPKASSLFAPPAASKKKSLFDDDDDDGDDLWSQLGKVQPAATKPPPQTIVDISKDVTNKPVPQEAPKVPVVVPATEKRDAPPSDVKKTEPPPTVSAPDSRASTLTKLPAQKSSRPLFGSSDEDDDDFSLSAKTKVPAPAPVKSTPTVTQTPNVTDKTSGGETKAVAKVNNPLFGDDSDDEAQSVATKAPPKATVAAPTPTPAAAPTPTPTPTPTPAPVVTTQASKATPKATSLFDDDDDDDDGSLFGSKLSKAPASKPPVDPITVKPTEPAKQPLAATPAPSLVDPLVTAKKDPAPVQSPLDTKKPEDDTPRASQANVGKLKRDLLINPAALLPGARPARTTRDSADDQTDSPPSQSQPQTASATVKEASVAGSSDTLDSMTKSRVRGSAKRRPPSRAPASSQNEPLSAVSVPGLEDDTLPDISSIRNSVPSVGNSSAVLVPPKVTTPVVVPPSSTSTSTSSKREEQPRPNEASIFDDETDIFNDLPARSAPVEKPKTFVQVSSDRITTPPTTTSPTVQTPNTKSDGKIPASNSTAKKAPLDDDDDDSDIFASDAKKKAEQAKAKAASQPKAPFMEPPPLIADDDDLDDIFSDLR